METAWNSLQGGAGEVRQSEVIAALSHALDMTEGHPVGQAERTLPDRHAHRARAAARRGVELRALLRAAAQGRGLLVVGGAHVRAVRHRRHRAQDARQARRLDEARPGRALHLAARRRRRPHRPGPAHALGAALARGRGQGDRRDALRPRRRDRHAASASPTRAAGALRGLDEYWDGRGQPSACRGGDPAAGAHRLPRARRPRCSSRRTASPPRTRWCASAAGAGSIRCSPTSCWRSGPRTALWSDLGERRRRRAGARRSSRPTACWC